MASISLALMKWMEEALMVTPPNVKLAVVAGVKLVPVIGMVMAPPLPALYGLTGAATLTALVCVAVSVKSDVAAAPETLSTRM